MKIKFYSFIVLLTIGYSAQSQFTKGEKWVGGSVSFGINSSNYNYQSTTGNNFNNNASLNPRFSWATSANHMQGLLVNLNYGRNKAESTTSPGTQKNSNGSVGTGYFFRSYKEITGTFGWFLEYNGTFNYFYYRQQATYLPSSLPSSDTKSSGVGVGLSALPGLYYRISNPLLIEASFGGIGANYNHSVSGYNKTNSFNAGINFPSNFSFGVQFLLSGKK